MLRFSGKKLLNIKCVFLFSPKLLPGNSLKNAARYYLKNVHGFSCKVPVILVRFDCNLDLLERFSKNNSNIKFHENPSSGSRVVPRGRTDMTKLKSLFAILRTRLKSACPFQPLRQSAPVRVTQPRCRK